MQNNNLQVSYFNSVTDKSPKKMTFGEVINSIRGVEVKVEVQSIRDLYKDGRQKEGDKMKKKLPAFTASGVFNQGHKAHDLEEYAGRIILDFDKLGDKVMVCKEKAKELPFTESAFISPSGGGLKVTVRVDSPKEEHKKMFGAVKQYYEQALGVPADPSGKDVSRLCFLSWDEDVYYNPASQIFTYEDLPEMPVVEKAEKLEVPQGAMKLVGQVLVCCERKYGFTPGNRNDSLFKTACWANELGIPAQELIDEATKRYSAPDFTSKEIEDTISRVYKDNAEHFGEKSNEAISDKNDNCDKNDTGNDSEITLEEEANEESLLQNSPYIPDEVFSKLPKLIKEMLPLAHNNRERDILTWGALTTLSGCMPTVYCRYGNRKIHPHLYLFVTAGPAQGKGILNNASQLIGKFNQLIRIESEREVKEYKKKLEEWDAIATKKRRGGNPADLSTKPEEVHLKVLLFPQRFSRAAMVQQLAYNGPLGMIVFAPEADALVTANKADYGGFMDCLRQAFQHEDITSAFKVDGEQPREVKTPKWAVLISGTKNQFFKFFTTTEDGTFSRFAQYCYSATPEWINQFSENEVDIVAPLADEWCRQADALRKRTLKVTFSKAQQSEMNQTFESLSKEAASVENEDFLSSIRRHAHVWLRVAMTLTGIREGENPSALDYRECSQEDFEIAKALTMTSLKHALLLSTALCEPEIKKTLKSPTRMHEVLKKMPSTFTTQEMIKQCEAYQINKRHVQRFLCKNKGILVMSEKKSVWSKME